MFSFLSTLSSLIQKKTKKERLERIFFPLDALPPEFLCRFSEEPIEEALSLDGCIVDKKIIEQWWARPRSSEDSTLIFNKCHPYTNQPCHEIKPALSFDKKFDAFICEQEKAYAENKRQYNKKIILLNQKVQALNAQIHDSNQKLSDAEKKQNEALIKEMHQFLMEKEALEQQPPETFFTGCQQNKVAPIKHTLSLSNIVSRTELFEDARGGLANLASSSNSIEHYPNEHFFMGLASLQALTLPHCFRDEHTNEKLTNAYLAYDEAGDMYVLNKSTLDNFNSSYLPKTQVRVIRSEADAPRQEAINDFFNRLKEIANAIIDYKAHETDPYLNAIHLIHTQLLLECHIRKTKDAIAQFTLKKVCEKEIKQVLQKEINLLETYSIKLAKIPEIQLFREEINKMAEALISIKQYRQITKEKENSFKDYAVLQFYLDKFIAQAKTIRAKQPITPEWPWLDTYEQEQRDITQQMKLTLPRPSR